MRLQEILKKAMSAGSGVIAAAGVGFLLTLALSRFLAPQIFGAVAVALTWATIGSQISQMGFLRGSTKIVANTEAEHDRQTLKSFLQFAFGVATLCSFIGIIVLLLALGSDSHVDRSVIPIGVLAAALLWPMTMARVISGILLGKGNDFLGSFAQTGLINTGLLLGLLVAIALGVLSTRLDLTSILVCGAFVAAIFGIGVTVWRSRDLWKIRRSSYRPIVWLTLSVPLMIVGAIQLMNRQIGVAILGEVVGHEAVAAYYPALRISDFAMLGLMGLNAALAPRIAILFHQGKKDELQGVLKKAAVISFISTTAIALLGSICAPFLLMVFGGVAVQGTTALRILLISQALSAAAGSAGVLTAMAGQERFTAVTAFLILIVNIALLKVLVPILAITGAAIATGLAAVAWNTILLIRCYRKLGLDPSILSVRFADLSYAANRIIR